MRLSFMRFLFGTFFLLLCAAYAHGQTEDIKELERRHLLLKEEIKKTQKLLQHTNTSLTSQVNQVALLNAQINERKRYLLKINADLLKIDKEIALLTRQLHQLQAQLKEKKKNYENSLRYLRKNRSIQNQLMFVFSADTFNQFYRRIKYVSQFADFQKTQGLKILKNSEEIRNKKKERMQTKLVKSNLLSNRKKEYEILQKEELAKKQLLSSLQRKSRQLNAQIKKKEAQAKRLNDKIDQLIAKEIDQSEGKTKQAKGKINAVAVDYKLANDFVKNKGRLPLPITGAALIIHPFGRYSVDGLRHVQLDNKGIDIQAEPGAKARAIFKGKVVAIFKLENLFNILIRHGNYISVYCNLVNVQVKNMQDVDTMQPLGEVYTNLHQGGQTILHFQLRKEKAKLNPEDWIRKE